MSEEVGKLDGFSLGLSSCRVIIGPFTGPGLYIPYTRSS